MNDALKNAPRFFALACLSFGIALGCASGGAAPKPAAPAPAAPATATELTASVPKPPPPPTPAPLPVPPPPAPLPQRGPDAIIADMVSAIGGASALEGHKSIHTKMEITFKGLGIAGSAEHWAATGDRTLTTTSIPGVATSREGSDGKRVWSESPIDGLRILEGIEAEQARVEATWNVELRMREAFAKIEAKNELGDGGQSLECLVLTTKAGGATTNCFDPTTHLMVLQRGVRSGPQGEMPYTARMSDWRAVGDIKFAFSTEMQVGPMSFTGRVVTAELDVPVDATMFALPGKPTLGPGGPTEKAKARPSKKVLAPMPKR